MIIPQDDIDWAKSIEDNLSEIDRELYMECLDDRPFSVRVENLDVRDGCILSRMFAKIRDEKAKLEFEKFHTLNKDKR